MQHAHDIDSNVKADRRPFVARYFAVRQIKMICIALVTIFSLVRPLAKQSVEQDKDCGKEPCQRAWGRSLYEGLAHPGEALGLSLSIKRTLHQTPFGSESVRCPTSYVGLGLCAAKVGANSDESCGSLGAIALAWRIQLWCEASLSSSKTYSMAACLYLGADWYKNLRI